MRLSHAGGPAPRRTAGLKTLDRASTSRRSRPPTRPERGSRAACRPIVYDHPDALAARAGRGATVAWAAPPTARPTTGSDDVAALRQRLTLTSRPARSATVTVTPVDDAVVEATETVALDARRRATGYSVGRRRPRRHDRRQRHGRGRQRRRDRRVGRRAGRDPIVFTVTRTDASPTQLVVNLTWSGTAAYGTDYDVTRHRRDAVGERPAVDARRRRRRRRRSRSRRSTTRRVESPRRVTLTLAAARGYTVGTPTSATGSIADNDALPSVTSRPTDASGAEQGARPDRLHGHAHRQPDDAIVVNLTWGGTATRGTRLHVSATGGTLSAERPAAHAGGGRRRRRRSR